jgi:hypothetical protein
MDLHTCEKFDKDKSMTCSPINMLTKDLFTNISTFVNCNRLPLVSKHIYKETQHIKKIYLPCEESAKYLAKPNFRQHKTSISQVYKKCKSMFI